jgi:hypothetical protein
MPDSSAIEEQFPDEPGTDEERREWIAETKRLAASGELAEIIANQPPPEEIVRRWRAGEL